MIKITILTLLICISTCYPQQNLPIDRQSFEFLCKRAHDLFCAKQYDAAADFYKEAAALNSTCAGVFFNLGQALYYAKKYPEALNAYKKTIEHNKNYYRAYIQIAQVMIDVKQPGDAIAPLEMALTLDPDNMPVLFNLGSCYTIMSNKDKAIAAFNNCLRINPHSLEALYNKAFVYKTFGDLDTAIEIYQHILTINPHYTLAHNGLGIAYVTQGNFELGWKHHEVWFANNPHNGTMLKSFLQNNEIENKKILLHSLGGLGDTFQFIRYAERLKNMGAHVIVNCQKNLLPLLSYCPYIDQLIGNATTFPDYDAETTLMIIPSIFADTQESAPKKIPYLFADPELVAHWQQKLAPDKNFKVGICWQSVGHKSLPLIAHRGCPLKHFSCLGALDGVSFYSLQNVDGLEQLTTLSSDFPLHVFDNLDESGAFMDTAALIKNLDLIITVDTSIAHLAGGLGANVWMIHPYATADWRWIINRADSYWYPHLRIFKQQKPFDWEGVMENVYTKLQKLIYES